MTVLIAAALWAAAMVGVAAWRASRGQGDFADFYYADAATLYEAPTEATLSGAKYYLPFLLILFEPLTLLPIGAACAAFNMASLAMLVLSVVCVDRWLVDRRGDTALARIAVPVAMIAAYVHACLHQGQLGLLVLCLVVTCWVLVEQRRRWTAGAVLSIAILVKMFPAILLVFFVLKRSWRVVGGALAGLVVMGAGLSVAAYGPRKAWEYHRQYVQRVVVGHSAVAMVGGREGRYNNQSLSTVVGRLLLPVNAGGESRPFGVHVADLSRPVGRVMGRELNGAQVVFLAIAAALVLAAVVATRRPAAALSWPRLRAEFSAWALLGLALSPVLWVHYLPLAYLPLALLWAAILRRRAAGHQAWALWAVCGVWWLGVIGLASPWLRAVGMQLLGVLLLAGAMALWPRESRPAPNPQDHS